MESTETLIGGRPLKYIPLVLSELILLATLGVLILLSLSGTSGTLVYPLDDPYIHMATAKEIAEHGNWGIDSSGFCSVSSSPLWTGILAMCYWFVGPSTWAPLVINILAAMAAIGLIFYLINQLGFSGWRNFLLLNVFIFLIPLPTLVMSGQEHILHIIVSLLFAFLLVMCCWSAPPSPQSRIGLIVLAPMLTSLRYEGLFLLFVGIIMLLLRRRLPDAVAGLAVGLAPVMLFGFASLEKGWYFVPNSVLLKGSKPELAVVPLVKWALVRFKLLYQVKNVHMLVLLFGSLAALYGRLGESPATWRDKTLLWLIVFLSAFIPHAAFASYGWLFRYEAYLVAIALVALAAILADPEWLDALFPRHSVEGVFPRRLRQAIMICMALLATAPLFYRGVSALTIVPAASRNIYKQQYQMAMFTKLFYNNSAVALNDIGAVSFYSNARIVDLFGLASLDVAERKISRSFDTTFLEEIVDRKKASIIMIYDSWFFRPPDQKAPHEWIKVGCWTIPDRVICDNDRVSFYVRNRGELQTALENLRKFAALLPKDVRQEGLYTQSVQ